MNKIGLAFSLKQGYSRKGFYEQLKGIGFVEQTKLKDNIEIIYTDENTYMLKELLKKALRVRVIVKNGAIKRVEEL